MKYKQNIIPSVVTPTEWSKMKASDLRKAVFNYMVDNFNGEDVKNESLQIIIRIRKKSLQKTAFGEAMYGKKAATVQILPKLLRYAEYNNWGDRKATDPATLIGYLNFKVKCYIDGTLENLRIAVRLYKDGKFYYNIEVNKRR